VRRVLRERGPAGHQKDGNPAVLHQQVRFLRSTALGALTP
jgi:hypothetical protein